MAAAMTWPASTAISVAATSTTLTSERSSGSSNTVGVAQHQASAANFGEDGLRVVRVQDDGRPGVPDRRRCLDAVLCHHGYSLGVATSHHPAIGPEQLDVTTLGQSFVGDDVGCQLDALTSDPVQEDSRCMQSFSRHGPGGTRGLSPSDK